MLASQVNIPCNIETKTDAVRCVHKQHDLDNWLSSHGDQVVIYHPGRKTYVVPAFQPAQDKWCAGKLAYCNRYGCE